MLKFIVFSPVDFRGSRLGAPPSVHMLAKNCLLGFKIIKHVTLKINLIIMKELLI